MTDLIPDIIVTEHKIGEEQASVPVTQASVLHDFKQLSAEQQSRFMKEAYADWLKSEDISSTLPHNTKLQALIHALEDFYGEKICAQGIMYNITNGAPPQEAPDSTASANVSQDNSAKKEAE